MSWKNIGKIALIIVGSGIIFFALKNKPAAPTAPQSTPLQQSTTSGKDSQNYAIFGFIPPTASITDKQYLFDAAARTGKTLLRLDFPQFVIEPSENQFQWAKIDESVKLADERGIKIEGILGWTTKWSVDENFDFANSPCKTFKSINGPILPTKFNAYINYIKETVKRYPQIVYWEVWNEPNIPRGFCGSTQDYAHLLSSAYTVIKQTNPHAQVLIGGLTGGAFVPKKAEMQSWFDQVLSYSQYDVLHKFDIFNIHIYGSSPTQMGSTISKIKQSLINKGRDDAPLWITEMGYPSDLKAQTNPKYNYGESAQADFLKVSLPLMVRSGADKVFMLLRDMTASEGECKTNPHHQFCSDGLVTFPQFNNPQARRDKPSMTVFQQL